MPSPGAVALIALLALPAGLLAGEAPGAGRSRLDGFLQGFASLSADFEQRLFDEYGELLETSKGRVRIAKPGRFAWEYASPYQQAIICDGKTLWVYDADLEQVTINAIEAASAGSPAKLLGEDVDVDAEYEVAELGERDGALWVRLTPRIPDQQYQTVEIGFAETAVAGMRLEDNLGQVTDLRFSNAVRNGPVDAASFEFTPPPGVDIVRGVAQ